MSTTTRKKTGGRVAGTPNKATAARKTEGDAVDGEGPDPVHRPDTRRRARVRLEVETLMGVDGTLHSGLVPKLRKSKGRRLLEVEDTASTEALRSTFPRYKLARVDHLVPYANNARTHSDAQVEKIAASIREFGFTNPVLTDGKGGIVAGHGRVLGAQLLGMDVVPTIELGHLTDDQRRAYIIADNKLALDAGWDDDMLRLELSDLELSGFNLDLTGFSGTELDVLFADREAGETDPDETPAVGAQAISRLGDVWLLGGHRLMCGDSTSPSDVAVLASGREATLCFTSPPYAQQRDYKGEAMHWDELMRGVFAALPVAAGAQLLVNLGMVHRDGEWLPYWDGWIEWMRAEGWRRFGWYVWDQGFGLPGDWNGRLAPSHEWIFHFNRTTERARKTHAKNPENVKARADGASTMRGKDGKTKKFTNPEASAQATKIPDSVIRINRQVGRVAPELDHPAVFPVALAAEMLTAFSDRGDIVYEPFSGSGTQIIAAHENGRICLAMELAPEYVDVAVRRWQAFADAEATLEADGRTFAAVEAERVGTKGNPDGE